LEKDRRKLLEATKANAYRKALRRKMLFVEPTLKKGWGDFKANRRYLLCSMRTWYWS